MAHPGSNLSVANNRLRVRYYPRYNRGLHIDGYLFSRPTIVTYVSENSNFVLSEEYDHHHPVLTLPVIKVLTFTR